MCKQSAREFTYIINEIGFNFAEAISKKASPKQQKDRQVMSLYICQSTWGRFSWNNVVTFCDWRTLHARHFHLNRSLSKTLTVRYVATCVWATMSERLVTVPKLVGIWFIAYILSYTLRKLLMTVCSVGFRDTPIEQLARVEEYIAWLYVAAITACAK